MTPNKPESDMKNKKLCSCGFPQSSPIPHEHDRTEKEKKYEYGTKELKCLFEFGERFRKKFPLRHYYCEDCWYSCPKSEEGSCDESKGDECDCNAENQEKELLDFILSEITASNKALLDKVLERQDTIWDSNEDGFEVVHVSSIHNVAASLGLTDK